MDLREDDLKFGDTSDFAEIGYAPLKQALAHPGALKEIVEGYIARDRIFPDYLPAKAPGFVVNSVDDLQVGADKRLLGRGFPA